MDHMSDSMVTESAHGMTGMNMSGGGSHAHSVSISDAEIYIEAILITAAILVGIVANSLALATFRVSKQLRSGIYVLFANLSITGLMIAALCMPFHLTGVVARFWPLGDLVCELEAHLVSLCALVSLVTHTEIALVRYAAATAPQHIYRKLSDNRGSLLLAALAWIIGGVLQGIAAYQELVVASYSPLYSRCTPVNMKNVIMLVIAGSLLIAGFYGVICFCYARLFIVIRRKVATVTSAPSARNRKFLHVTKALLILSVLLVVAWLPFIVICGVDPSHDQLPVFVHRLGHDTAEILSCINPIFYFLRIEDFKRAVRQLLGFPAARSEDSDESTATTKTNARAATKVTSHNLKVDGPPAKVSHSEETDLQSEAIPEP